MKIRFGNKKWFDFLRYKLPKNTRLHFDYLEKDGGKYLYDNGLIELIVANSIKNLNEFVATSLPSGLQSTNGTFQFEFRTEGFSKRIRFCQTSEFDKTENNQYKLLYVPGRFLDDYTLDTDPPIDFKEKEENKMANNSGIWDMTKEDFKDGLWRNGANEMVEVVKFGILKTCKLQKMNKLMLKTIQTTLDYKVVTGGIHAALGWALTFVPVLSAHPQAKRMAKELRVEGNKYIQSEVIGVIKELVPDLLKILSTVSPEEETEQRIQVEEKVETKRISTPELIEHQASMEAMAEKETQATQAKHTAAATN